MFDVGFSELLIIAVVALVVLGPERLPKAARFAGLWVRKARAQWYSVKSELELELAQDEMKKHLQSVENSIKAPMQELQQDLEQAETEIQRGLDDAGEADSAPQDASADAAKATPRTFNVFADNSDAAGLDQPAEYPESSEQEPEPEAIAFEMDEPPGHAEAMPDGPERESPGDDSPDDSDPKQGQLW
ncbi:MAG TPA: Sec-independent protein translocase protein TatB [Arenimonas sp.]|nr:Sec-independent protein translocase protein TatB [Arenimonas sp.]